jgi:hypothetical protein
VGCDGGGARDESVEVNTPRVGKHCQAARALYVRGLRLPAASTRPCTVTQRLRPELLEFKTFHFAPCNRSGSSIYLTRACLGDLKLVAKRAAIAASHQLAHVIA